ncbi:TBP-associated factor IIF [Ophiocordyceps camponoti-floridani]|uniref:TBP-associated factor IIF n=1 Tax=Ophiocordyceps camponoti-floridani TaxID=2030778 RepID=A0A8H4Q7H9_9HYPO|nr:TBP-associated factor IIF [Ophiocordyceps camponoti-floridani]
MAGAKNNSGPASASAIRIRENQRRSRARRKEYVETMERRIQEYERRGVEATLEMQQAARTVALENGRLRLMLAHMGAGTSDVEAFLQQLRHRDAAHALSTVRLPVVDKLQVLASASVRQGDDALYAVLPSADSQSTESPSTESPLTESPSTESPSMESPSTVERSPGVSSCTRPLLSPATSTVGSPEDMSCDAAAQIIADMQCRHHHHQILNDQSRRLPSPLTR